MLIKIFAALSAAATLITALLAPAAGPWYSVVLTVVLIYLGFFVAFHLAYVVLLLIYTELFISFNRPQDKPSKFWCWHFHAVAEMVCFYSGVRLCVSGEELLPKDGRFLMVCNHRSLFDPIVKAAALKKEDLVYISKDKNFKIPIAGKVMHKCGCMSLDRENNREALKTIKHATEYINNDAASVVIYPEGTRCVKDELLPFHAGSFKIAQRAGVPVVVTVLRGTDDVRHNFPLRTTTVNIDIINVIDAEFTKNHKTQETAELAQGMIQKFLDSARKAKEIHAE